MPEGFEGLKLQDLVLGGGCPLVKKDETYATLAKITTLTDLSLDSSDMETLPEGICHWICLFLTYTMPEGIGGLVNLQTLNCCLCQKLESLPNSKIVLFSFIIL